MEIDCEAKIRWACRRGMLELDLMLLAYFDKHFHALTEKDRQCFTAILRFADPQILAWLIGQESPCNADHRHIIDDIRQKLDF